jgi:hypothetical protein
MIEALRDLVHNEVVNGLRNYCVGFLTSRGSSGAGTRS